MEKGYLALVLHAHLPFVRHPEHDSCLEEDWLFEAVTECYIPLLQLMAGWERDGIGFRLTLSLSPPLISMLTDPLLQERTSARLDRLIELSEKELERTRSQPEFQRLAAYYYETFKTAHDFFENRCQRDLVSAFNPYRESGRLEIITSAATHAYLPLLISSGPAVRAQIKTALDYYQSVFRETSPGFWLPECGYAPGLDNVLADLGIGYFFVETHGVMHARPRPRYGIFAPLRCRASGVAAFGRDLESSRQVWSAQEGYPGDPHYRDFYRDIGFDLDHDYIQPYLHADGARTFTGIKYYRVSGNTQNKQPYHPEDARRRAEAHAEDFLRSRTRQVNEVLELTGRNPILVAPFDAELFGHWWYEGPQWLDFLVRKAAQGTCPVKMVAPSEYLRQHPQMQTAALSGSSWGWKGYSEAWLNEQNDWIYRHLHQAGRQMGALARRFPRAEGQVRRALNQAARELLLAQSSDWAFIMTTGTLPDYAAQRTRTHLSNFLELRRSLLSGKVDQNRLNALESRNNIFPEINYLVYL